MSNVSFGSLYVRTIPSDQAAKTPGRSKPIAEFECKSDGKDGIYIDGEYKGMKLGVDYNTIGGNGVVKELAEDKTNLSALHCLRGAIGLACNQFFPLKLNSRVEVTKVDGRGHAYDGATILKGVIYDD